ncbi:collagenase [Burkholderia sp. AW49-1]
MLAPEPAFAESSSSRDRQVRMPRLPQNLPPSPEQAEYNLPLSKQDRASLTDSTQPRPRSMRGKRSAVNDCRDMAAITGFQAEALADHIANLPDYECHYGLFSIEPALATQIFSVSNLHAVANRFQLELSRYDATNLVLVNLLIYLRAAYYQFEVSALRNPTPNLAMMLRPHIRRSMMSDTLYRENPRAPSTANELMKLITNMQDEAYYLPAAKVRIERYTATVTNPQAAEPLRQPGAAGAFTGLLTVFFYAHQRPATRIALETDSSYPEVLDRFVRANRVTLSNARDVHLLADTAREAYRFIRYPQQKPRVKRMIRNMLAATTMTGAGNELWLAAAETADYNDRGQCADYGICDYKNRLIDAVLPNRLACNAHVRVLAQTIPPARIRTVCAAVARQEDYFHRMMKTARKPVAGDRNDLIDLVVFEDYTNYRKYASAIYGVNTDNGGIFLEGDPSAPDNRARIIMHEASWLRPQFAVWNLEHEFTHYLDARYDMAGDFAASTAKPTVWWIEGVAEYLSRRNDAPEAIDVVSSGTYRLADVFNTRYTSHDYVSRAYRWGYMATRFMFERHRNDVDAIVSRFRAGDYDGYERHVAHIGDRYDNEFIDWARTATTAGEPPQPSVN